jgi:hypothetical protein
MTAPPTDHSAEGRGHWAFKHPGDPVDAIDVMALRFLRSAGPHQIGVIEDDESLAAAIVFEGLKNRGLCIAGLGDGGPTYRITPAGLAAIPAEAA